MPTHEFSTPHIEYAARALRQFAHEHNVSTDDETISFVQDRTPDQVRRHGHAMGDSLDQMITKGFGRKFEVTTDVPRTIPLLLGRLAFYEQGHIESSEGVQSDRVRWLRLVNVKMDDPRVEDILSIVGATRSPDDPTPLNANLDAKGELILSTRHLFAGSDYAIAVSQIPYFEQYKIPFTVIDFSLPNIENRL